MDLKQAFQTIPQLDWFLLQPPSSLHGVTHTARVMVWASILSRDTPWFTPVLWAAACHDLRRQEDGRDAEHGFRAGQWVRENLATYYPLPQDTLELIANACTWHVTADRDTQWQHPVLKYLKDADGLDRVRLGDLNPRYLRFPASRPLIPLAEQLYSRTGDYQTPDQVWEIACEIIPSLADL